MMIPAFRNVVLFDAVPIVPECNQSQRDQVSQTLTDSKTTADSVNQKKLDLKKRLTLRSPTKGLQRCAARSP